MLSFFEKFARPEPGPIAAAISALALKTLLKRSGISSWNKRLNAFASDELNVKDFIARAPEAIRALPIFRSCGLEKGSIASKLPRNMLSNKYKAVLPPPPIIFRIVVAVCTVIKPSLALSRLLTHLASEAASSVLYSSASSTVVTPALLSRLDSFISSPTFCLFALDNLPARPSVLPASDISDTNI